MSLVPSDLRIGDLIFFEQLSHSEDDFAEAVLSSGGTDGQIVHVALVASLADGDNDSLATVVHATEIFGVTKEPLRSVIERWKEKAVVRLLFARIKDADSLTGKAVEIGLTKVGCPYNDIFSSARLNSAGKEAYYCCQLVRYCYETAAGRTMFETQPLNFTDPKTGSINPYWTTYFEQRGMAVPVDDRGSHPQRLLREPSIDVFQSVLVR